MFLVNVNNNNNANFSYDNIPDVPPLDPADIITKNEDPVLKKIDSVPDGQTREKEKKDRTDSKPKCCIFKSLSDISRWKYRNWKRNLDLCRFKKIIAERLELQFYYGGENSEFKNKLETQGLDSEMETFAEYLMLVECARVLRRNKTLIHLEMVNTFFKNQNSEEVFTISFTGDKITTKHFWK